MSNYLNTLKHTDFAASARAIESLLNKPRNPGKVTVTVLLKEWIARFRQRRHLANLPDHLLRDIGISREAAQAEAFKPFWKA